MFKRLRKYLDRTKCIREVGSFDEAGLICAVEEGNLPCLEILIHAGISVDALSERGVPAISRAIDKEGLPALRLLVQSGGDINQKSKTGNTPLMHAIDQGNKHIFAYLLELEPELEIQDLKGETALFRAIRDSNTTFARKLIEAGAACEHRNRDGSTPLMLAVDHEKIGIVKALLNAGVDPRVTDRKGHSVLDRHHLSPRITKMLQKSAQELNKDQDSGKQETKKNNIYDGLIPAYLLSQSSQIGSLALGLINGLIQSLNAQDKIGEWEEHAKQALGWLKTNIQPYVGNQSPPSSSLETFPPAQINQAFWEAIKHGSVPLTQLCLQLGADINMPTPTGERSLHLALPYPEVIQVLLDAGARVDLADRQGESAISRAYKEQLTEAITILESSL